MKLNEIFFVLVLYKHSIEDSKTIITLNSQVPKDTFLFVYDNSPKIQYEKNSFLYGNFRVSYFHDVDNRGLSYAYNYALKKANKLGFSWLLLLDQDTTFTDQYISSLKKNGTMKPV